MTGSLGILSEAVHSVLDVGATTITYFAVRYADLFRGGLQATHESIP